MDAFTHKVIETMNIIRRQGFGPPFGTRELTPCDQRWIESMTLMLCSNVRKETPTTASLVSPLEFCTPTMIQAPTKSSTSLGIASISTTRSLSQKTSATSESDEEPLIPTPKRKKFVAPDATQVIWPAVHREITSRFTDVFDVNQFLDFVITFKDQFILLSQAPQTTSRLNHFLDILTRVFPNVAYTGNPIEYVPNSQHVLNKLDKHNRVLVIPRRATSAFRVTRLAGFELEKDVVDELDRSNEVRLDMGDILDRLNKSSQHLLMENGLIRDPELYYSIFASLLSLTMPTYVTITKNEVGLCRFYARVIDSYTVHYNYKYQDCLRFIFLNWTQGVPRYEKATLCAYPTQGKYMYDPSLLKWKNLAQQRQNRSEPRDEADCLPREYVKELFPRTPRPRFFNI